MYCVDIPYIDIWLFLLDCLFSVHSPFISSCYKYECVSLNVYIFFLCAHMHVSASVCCYHQQCAAFNEGDGRKINIVPWKMISSLPFIASHFHPFIVWERVHGGTERERKFESLHPSVNISLSSFYASVRLYSSLLPQLCMPRSVF